MDNYWISWTDNAGCRIAARLRDICAIVEADDDNLPEDARTGRPVVGIKLESGLISWLDTTFEEVARHIYGDGVMNGAIIQTGGRTLKTQRAPKQEVASEKVEDKRSIPEIMAELEQMAGMGEEEAHFGF